MDASGDRPIARLRTLARISSIYAVALVVLLQGYGILRGVVAGEIYDPWLATVPVLWFDIALVVILLFLWGLSFGGAPGERGRPNARTWLAPDFPAIRSALRSRSLRSWVLGSSVGYAVLVMVLTGLLVVDPAGTAPSGPSGYPFLEVFDAPLGWGPKLVWAPNAYVVAIVRPYTAAIAALLGLLAGFGIGLVGHGWTSARASPLPRSTAGAAAGLLVLCPACAASPTFAFVAGLLTPTAAGETAAAAGLATGPIMVFSSAMLLASVVLLWAGIARASRTLPNPELARDPRPEAAVPRRQTASRWALAMAVVLAIGALLFDLSAAPPPAAYAGGHSAGIAPVATAVHPLIAIGLAMLGVAFALLGTAYGSGRGNHRVALAVGLTLVYADGLAHWFAILEHLGEAPSAVFFLMTGAVQIAAIPLALRRPAVLWWTAVAFTTFLIALFVITRFVPPPFALEPEPVELLGILSKAIEAGILAAMAVVLGRRMLPGPMRRSPHSIRT